MKLTKKACALCGTDFMSCRTSHVYCSDNCRVKAHRSKVKGAEPVVEQAKLTLFQMYKQQLALLSKEEILGALGKMWTESAEAFHGRHKQESLLANMLREKQQ